MYRFSTNVKKIIHNDKLVLINLNTGQWIRMSMTVYKIIDKFIVKKCSIWTINDSIGGWGG